MQYHQRYGQTRCHPAGESRNPHLRVDFDRRLKLEFHGSKVTSDAGFIAYRELDDALGLTEVAGGLFQDSRTGKNGRHGMVGQFRQSVYGRLGGYDDVNDADRLGRDPAMRWIVGGHAVTKQAASTSQMGRFETELLASDENFAALTDLSGVWIDKVHDRRPPKMIILDMDSSVSPTHGEQEGTAYNGHFGCSCYHPLFVFNQFVAPSDPETGDSAVCMYEYLVLDAIRGTRFFRKARSVAEALLCQATGLEAGTRSARGGHIPVNWSCWSNYPSLKRLDNAVRLQSGCPSDQRREKRNSKLACNICDQLHQSQATLQY